MASAAGSNKQQMFEWTRGRGMHLLGKIKETGGQGIERIKETSSVVLPKHISSLTWQRTPATTQGKQEETSTVTFSATDVTQTES